MRLINWYWDGLMGKLTGLLERHFAIEIAEGNQALAFKIGVTVLLVFLIFEIYFRIRNAIQSYLDSKKKFIDVSVVEDVENPFIDSIEAAKNPNLVVTLVKEKKYARAAAIYASVNEHENAAKYYKKAGDLKSAADNLSKIGQTAGAAKLLMKHGDYPTAARFFEEAGDHAKAAKAYQLAGEPAKAALASANAGNAKDAAEVFADYFATTQDAAERQVEMANACYAWLSGEFADQIEDEKKRALFAEAAKRFMQAERTALAAECYRQAGDHYRAAHAHVQMKQPETAVALLKQMDPAHPEFAASRPILAKSLYDARDYAQCAATLAPLLQKKKPEQRNLDLFYLFGLSQEQQGKIGEAITTFTAIKAVNPNYGDLQKRIPALQARLP